MWWCKASARLSGHFVFRSKSTGFCLCACENRRERIEAWGRPSLGLLGVSEKQVIDRIACENRATRLGWKKALRNAKRLVRLSNE